MPRLTAADIDHAYTRIDPVFLNSPQYECEPLSEQFGCRVVLKVETQNPIRSFKGRGADWLLTNNTAPALVCASAGNFGQAMAYATRKANIPIRVYASTRANAFKIERMRALAATVVLHGDDFDAAKAEARRVAAAEPGVRFVEDSLDIETLVGAGTIALELLHYPAPLDAVLIPLGNGALFNGMATYLKTHHPRTQTIAVQAKGAPAMIDSYAQQRTVVYDHIDTIADGIGVRVPVEQALTDMAGLMDAGLLVTDDQILNAMRWLHRYAGLVVEPSGAAGLAALMANTNLFTGKTVAVIICGGNLTAEQIEQWL